MARCSASICPIFVGCLYSSSGGCALYGPAAAFSSGRRNCWLCSTSISSSQSGKNPCAGRTTRDRYSVGVHAALSFRPRNQRKTPRSFLESRTTNLERSGLVFCPFWISDWGNPSGSQEFASLLQDLLHSTRVSHFPDLRNCHRSISLSPSSISTDSCCFWKFISAHCSMVFLCNSHPERLDGATGMVWSYCNDRNLVAGG